MINIKIVKMYELLQVMDKKLDKLLKKRKVKKNKHKPPAPTYMDK